MHIAEKIALIDKAIDEVLKSLEDGVGITEYSIDGMTIKKKSPLEVITELKRLKSLLKEQQRPDVVQYVFGG